MCFYIEMFQWRIWWQVFNLCQINKICGQKKGILSITCHYKTKQHAVYHHVTNFNKHGGNLFSASIDPNEKTFHLRLKMSCNLSAKVHCPVLKFQFVMYFSTVWMGRAIASRSPPQSLFYRDAPVRSRQRFSAQCIMHTLTETDSTEHQPYDSPITESARDTHWVSMTLSDSRRERWTERERSWEPSGPNEEQSQARWT